ncbi:MoxR family ATPase [Solwaraspora sp. WMMD406]|uniref:AAA family ATPase n=1 Tax=Solwaraspora sp. WMMD406 TaxID=3016095 RepID=UPI0024180A98|nr:MoxR family ATPase [Solwaraspora sp. WMMD406]MDG4767822.1 MoxR family ATPase [Solwaraspora sp. WMMD406]
MPEPHTGIRRLPPPPPWREFDGGPPVPLPPGEDQASQRRLGDLHRAVAYRPDPTDLDLINAALYLRRPLLVTGRPGIGKSTLAASIAHELALGPVLRWPISSRSTLAQGLYSYDAVGRLHDAGLAHRGHDGGGRRGHDADQGGEYGGEATPSADIGRYLRLGPLGTALLPYEQPRVLLIDEIDKGDIDLPNDLLNVFEEGEYAIPELRRVAVDQPRIRVQIDGSDELVTIEEGRVRCRSFPIVIMTSNGERDFPPAFLRRCLQLKLREPSREHLASIVAAHFGADLLRESDQLVDQFLARRDRGTLATDQLLNAIYLTSNIAAEDGRSREQLAELLFVNQRTNPDY